MAVWHFCLQALYWLLASIQALLWLFVKLMLAVICKLLNGFVFVKLGLGCFDVQLKKLNGVAIQVQRNVQSVVSYMRSQATFLKAI